jgi:secreted trypsin-like serine protease
VKIKLKTLLSMLLMFSSSAFCLTKEYEEPTARLHSSIVTISHSKNNFDHTCTGAIVDRYTIVTAAHCLEDSMAKYVVLRIGNNVNVIDYFKITRVQLHPLFYTYSPYDVGFAYLDRELPDWVRPVVISQPKLMIGKKLRFTGGGWNRLTGFSGLLDSTDVTVNKVLSKRLTVTSKDASICTGDSGGPLYSIQGDDFHLYGVASFGKKGSGLCYTKMSFASSDHLMELMQRQGEYAQFR